MAKIKVESQSTGTGIYTLKTGAASTNYSATLPDSTGTLLDSTSTLDATKLSGNLPAISGASLTGISAADNTPSFHAYKSGGVQVISASTDTKLVFNAEDWDTDSSFDSTTNYRFTVPSGEAGKYAFHAGSGISRIMDTDVSTFTLFFKKNGTNFSRGEFLSYIWSSTPSGGYADPKTTISVTMDLSVGDYVETYIVHTDNSSQNTARPETFFSGYKLAGV